MKKQTLLVPALLGLTVVACTDDLASTTTTEAESKLLRSAAPVPNEYIVVLNDGASDVQALSQEHARAYGAQVTREFHHALRGYVLRGSEAAARSVAEDPRVRYVEENGVVEASATQSGATWGIDRIDQRTLPLNQTYAYNATGAGVSAYIIDTGIRITHADLGGRAFHGFTAINDGNGSNDCNGHGTHVAGTVGGTTYGVAKDVTLYAVRVLDCGGSGSYAGVIAGIDWVTANAQLPAVANMSLGGSFSQAVNDATTASIASGVVHAIAAGNSNANACNYSPAATPNALTVGATTSTDARSSFSNFGTCVDIFAPGSSITSSWSTGDTATNTISGTSMASPHVCGAAALYLSANPTASPAQVEAALEANATPSAVTSPGTGSPNLLLYTAFIGGGGGGGSITLSAAGSKQQGNKVVSLTWSGATSTSVDVYRNGSVVTTTANDGAHSENLGKGGSTTFTYRVCEAGTSVCSGDATVTF